METKRIWTMTIAALCAVAVLAAPLLAAADTWNERTELTFSEPVMIPGATLQPGTYIFKLADSRGTRHLVQVYKSDGGELVTQTQAVPVRRPEPLVETMLTFNPSDRGVPALKAWYYPHSSYGHEFIYPEEQARQIAERSKTIVLSVDVEGTDLEKGILRLYDPSGTRTDWRADSTLEKEWETWQRDRAVVRTANNPQRVDDDDDENGKSRAPMMVTDPTGLRVELDDLESNPSKYFGKKVSVDAEVEEVYGPRLFTIDEPHWGDLDGEILVYAPTTLAALVSDDDRLTITGTLKTIALAEIEREWGWFELEPDIEVDFLKKPVLIADRIVGGDNNRAMFIEMNAPMSPAGNTTGVSSVIMDPGMVGSGTSDLVGRQVDLKGVRVMRLAHGGGFFVDAPGGAVLVLPAHTGTVTVTPGESVSLQGAIAKMPRRMAERVNPPTGWNRHIYVVATAVSK